MIRRSIDISHIALDLNPIVINCANMWLLYLNILLINPCLLMYMYLSTITYLYISHPGVASIHWYLHTCIHLHWHLYLIMHLHLNIHSNLNMYLNLIMNHPHHYFSHQNQYQYQYQHLHLYIHLHINLPYIIITIMIESYQLLQLYLSTTYHNL